MMLVLGRSAQVIAVLMATSLSACTPGEKVGGPNQPCYDDKTCDEGLSCIWETCYEPVLTAEELADPDQALDIDWVCLPAGEFDMGCPLYGMWILSTYCYRSHPQHSVTMAPYCIMTTEVTEDQFERVMGGNPSWDPRGPEYPVENLFPSQARDFCRRIGARLPTEAEWEYATLDADGQCSPCLHEDCFLETEWLGFDVRNKHPVATKPPGINGLYDMLGNVYEIVDDCWHDTFWGAPSTGYPAWSEKCDGTHILTSDEPIGVVKGWSYACNVGTEDLCVMSWDRHSYGRTGSIVGFRCVKDVPDP